MYRMDLVKNVYIYLHSEVWGKSEKTYKVSIDHNV